MTRRSFGEGNERTPSSCPGSEGAAGQGPLPSRHTGASAKPTLLEAVHPRGELVAAKNQVMSSLEQRPLDSLRSSVASSHTPRSLGRLDHCLSPAPPPEGLEGEASLHSSAWLASLRSHRVGRPVRHRFHLRPRDPPDRRRHYICPLIARFPLLFGPSLPALYRLRGVVGRGACSTVWLLVENETEQLRAGKFSVLSKLSPSNKNLMMSEAQNMQYCVHPCIIQCVCKYYRHGGVLLVLEYADAGDLGMQIDRRLALKKLQEEHGPQPAPSLSSSRHALPRSFDFEESEILTIFVQLCLAVNYLHQKCVLHRDIKPRNAFLTSSGLLKLGDFGFSQHLPGGVDKMVFGSFCGTPYYQAPEIWCRQPYSGKSDVWSLGVVLYELLTLEKPFNVPNTTELHARIVSGRYKPLPPHREERWTELLSWLLRLNAEERWSMKELMRCSLVQELALPELRSRIQRLPHLSTGERMALLEAVEAEMDNVSPL